MRSRHEGTHFFDDYLDIEFDIGSNTTTVFINPSNG